MTTSETDHIAEHLSRCIELYGAPIDANFKEKVSREMHEQMRADMMICVGIIAALKAPSSNGGQK